MCDVDFILRHYILILGSASNYVREKEGGRDLGTFGTEEITVPRAWISSTYLEEERRRDLNSLT